VEILVQSFGTALALGILADIFLTVLYVRGGAAWLSPQTNLAVWAGLRAAARLFPSASGRLLSFCGPALPARVPSAWVVLPAAEGVAVIPDEAAGAEAYVRLRREWDAALRGLAAHIGEKWSDIDPAGSAE
jgi:hypothetical protein